MTELATLRDALVEELKDLYSAEQQLLQALPKMERRVSNDDLKDAFRSHLAETKQQVDRLNQIAHALHTKLSGKVCVAMQGLIEEGNQTMQQDGQNEDLLDVVLVGCAQRIEHYEIAGYGAARAIADALGEEEIADLLDRTLAEESAANEKLSAIAEEDLLPELARLDSEMQDEEGEEGAGAEAK
jgi:ferritin-like metal-binding protein YciE